MNKHYIKQSLAANVGLSNMATGMINSTFVLLFGFSAMPAVSAFNPPLRQALTGITITGVRNRE